MRNNKKIHSYVLRTQSNIINGERLISFESFSSNSKKKNQIIFKKHSKKYIQDLNCKTQANKKRIKNTVNNFSKENKIGIDLTKVSGYSHSLKNLNYNHGKKAVPNKILIEENNSIPSKIIENEILKNQEDSISGIGINDFLDTKNNYYGKKGKDIKNKNINLTTFNQIYNNTFSSRNDGLILNKYFRNKNFTYKNSKSFNYFTNKCNDINNRINTQTYRKLYKVGIYNKRKKSYNKEKDVLSFQNLNKKFFEINSRNDFKSVLSSVKKYNNTFLSTEHYNERKKNNFVNYSNSKILESLLKIIPKHNNDNKICKSMNNKSRFNEEEKNQKNFIRYVKIYAIKKLQNYLAHLNKIMPPNNLC